MTDVVTATGSLTKVVVPTKDVALRNGETITVRPFKFGQLAKVLKHFGTLLAYADELGDIDIMAALEGASEEVFDLLGLSLKKQRDFFEDLELDEGTELAVAMVEVNQDFFVHHVLPLIKDYLPQDTEEIAPAETEAPPVEMESLSSDQTDELLGIPEDVIPKEMRITGQA